MIITEDNVSLDSQNYTHEGKGGSLQSKAPPPPCPRAESGFNVVLKSLDELDLNIYYSLDEDEDDICDSSILRDQE